MLNEFLDPPLLRYGVTVDPFLVEALQNPRHRLTISFGVPSLIRSFLAVANSNSLGNFTQPQTVSRGTKSSSGEGEAHELPQYGLTVGLTNYAAAYCIGLLLSDSVWVCGVEVCVYRSAGSWLKAFSVRGDEDEVMWSSMISADGFHGQGEEAIKLFNTMVEETEMEINEEFSPMEKVGDMQKAVDLHDAILKGVF
ncbi:unnamed protein product [Eruca vesicaria subsp. sativa]|uniref:Pentatricopeptide repeat-containing protein n=1 Tax=Eruca vesicaria subsp. sativa TaxID=29727 RepID=A0ABC8LSJ1_ERUVS|nr:unnamed protein product [Eruca vesicaria subsp. sativa]